MLAMIWGGIKLNLFQPGWGIAIHRSHAVFRGI